MGLVGKFRGYRSQGDDGGGVQPRKGSIDPRREATVSEHEDIYAYQDTPILGTVGINLTDGRGPPYTVLN